MSFSTFFNNKRQPEGFSLIETLIYVVILTLFLLMITNTLRSLARSYQNFRIGSDIQTAAIISIDRINREIRNAESYDTVNSVFGANPGKLTLNTTDDSGNPMTIGFYVQSGVIKIERNGAYVGPLTASSTSVTDLVFRTLENSNSKGIKTEATFTGGTGTALQSVNFYTSAILRNSY